MHPATTSHGLIGILFVGGGLVLGIVVPAVGFWWIDWRRRKAIENESDD